MRTFARLVICTLLLSGTVALCEPPKPAQVLDNPNDVTADKKMKEMEHERQKEFNKARHESLKRDTDKLLQLATELKLHVDKTNENVLSVDVIRKAEEIEKLSKDIQKKMRAN